MRPDRLVAVTLPVAAVALLLSASITQAANWKKFRGEFAGDNSDCIDFDSFRTDARGLTHFRRYVIDDNKACGRPNRYDLVENIAVSCRAVLAAGPNRDDFPVRYFSYDRTSRRGWEEGRSASRQFSCVMQHVCRSRK